MDSSKSFTRRRPAATSRLRREESHNILDIAADSSASDAGGTRIPQSSPTISPWPPGQSVATTGTLHAMASSTARPNPSVRDGETKTLALEMYLKGFDCQPRK